MPHNHMISREGRKEKCGDTCEGDAVVRSTALCNAGHVPGGRSAVVRNCKRQAQAGARRSVLVNGYSSHWGGARFQKVAPTKESELVSAVTDGLAALSIGSASSPGGVSVSLNAKPENGALRCNLDCKLPGPNIPAAKKKWRRIKFRTKRREITAVETSTLEKREEEEWEIEIEKHTKTNFEKTSGPDSYGPEDLMYFTECLSQGDATFLPGTASFEPVVHHASSIRWVQHHTRTETGQFEDAELASHEHRN